MESKDQIINKLLETIENISNKAVQANAQPIPQFLFEDDSNDTNKSEREKINTLQINSTSNDQRVRKTLSKKWIIY